MASTSKQRLGILFSGGGTTMEAVLCAIQDGRIPNMECVIAIASKPTAGGIERAQKAGISKENVVVVRPGPRYGERLLVELQSRGVDTLAQLGHLPITPFEVVVAFEGRAFNQHGGALRPGLVLANGTRLDFGGRGMQGRATHAAMFYYSQWVMNCTDADEIDMEVCSHLLGVELDGGKVIDFFKAAIFRDEVFEMFHRRALAAEHELQIRVLAYLGRHGTFPSSASKDELIEPRMIPLLVRARAKAIAEFPRG